MYDLLVWWHVHTKKFPKSERYTIAIRTFDLLLEVLIGVTKAEFLSGAAKISVLEQSVSPNIDATKILVRLANTLELFDDRTYVSVADELNQIGRMLGGWINDIRQGKSPR